MVQKQSEIVLCEAQGCEAFTVYKSHTWTKNFRKVWVEDLKKSLSACSDKCAEKIRGGEFRELNKIPKKQRSPSESPPAAPADIKPKQLNLW